MTSFNHKSPKFSIQIANLGIKSEKPSQEGVYPSITRFQSTKNMQSNINMMNKIKEIEKT